MGAGRECHRESHENHVEVRMGAFLRRLLAMFRRSRLERDLDDELALHLAMRTDEEVRRGRTQTAAESRRSPRSWQRPPCEGASEGRLGLRLA